MAIFSEMAEFGKLLTAFGHPVEDTPVFTVPCKGSRRTTNVEEAETAKKICLWLLGKGFANHEIGLIGFYADQVENLKPFCEANGIYVYTVEEVTGRSFDVAIILPTKKPIKSDIILNKTERQYTAFSRASQGIIFIMDEEAVRGKKGIYQFKVYYDVSKEGNKIYTASYF